MGGKPKFLCCHREAHIDIAVVRRMYRPLHKKSFESGNSLPRNCCSQAKKRRFASREQLRNVPDRSSFLKASGTKGKFKEV